MWYFHPVSCSYWNIKRVFEENREKRRLGRRKICSKTQIILKLICFFCLNIGICCSFTKPTTLFASIQANLHKKMIYWYTACWLEVFTPIKMCVTFYITKLHGVKRCHYRSRPSVLPRVLASIRRALVFTFFYFHIHTVRRRKHCNSMTTF